MSITIDKFYMEEINLHHSKDPMEIFKTWYNDAKNQNDNILPEQMTLSTVRKDGGPSSRTLLLRGFDKQGFKMYWDSRSRKTEEIEEDTRGALIFVWFFRDRMDNLGYKQVRIEGTIEKLGEAEMDRYFESEPVASKIRANVCHQSRIVRDRKILLEESQQLLEKVKSSGFNIPRPKHYTGYRLRPTSIEFYKGSRDTINDRVRFRLPLDKDIEIGEPEDLPEGVSIGENGWVYERLEP